MRTRLRMPGYFPGLAAVIVAGGIGLTACGGVGKNTIVLYNGQHPQLTAALVTAFEEKTGIQVLVRTDDGVVLADQILEEGSSSPADVYLTENSPELMMLTQHGLLAKLPNSIVGQVPEADDSPTGNWVGVALRVGTLVYNPSLVSPAQLPKKLLDLAGPQWKGKVAFAPTDSDFVPLVGAVLATYGDASATSWLSGLKDNAVIYQDDEAVVAAVNNGTQAVGIINQYYWYRLRLEVSASAMHSSLYYFPDRDVGGIENVSGAAVLASSTHKANAEKFLAFLVSAEGQRILATGDDFEYPARPGIAPNPQLPPLTSLDPAVISVVKLGNDLAAGSLIRQVGLV